ncbi:MAG: P22 coat protein - protein 5 domain protein [Acidobacteria bacterium]|nr:P22 coat protein - protein 5 domain protein [Acidobacteriota bacterium]
MALTFIPTVWVARLLTALEKALVYGQPGTVNRDYEGEIAEAGDTVKIASIGDPTIGTYTKNVDIPNPEILTDAEQTLIIDQSRYFNFYVDSIDRAQQNVNVMDEAMRRAAYGLRDVQDQFIAAAHAQVPAANLIGSDAVPITPTNANAYEYLVDLSVKLDEANIPTEGRFCIVPSWFHGRLLKDNRFVSAGTSKTDSVLANGMVGEAAGFNILKSNNVPNTAGTKYKILAGHSMAYSFALQITSLEAYKPEKRFGNAVKGLNVYGGKLVRPTAWAVLTANAA